MPKGDELIGESGKKMGRKKFLARKKTSKTDYGEPSKIKTLLPRVGRMRGEMALCYPEKLAGKESYKNNQVFLKVARWRERKSELEVLSGDIEEKIE